MTLLEAQQNIGATVIYTTHGKQEEGIIVRVSQQFVFVRYGDNDTSIKATPAGMLTLVRKP